MRVWSKRFILFHWLLVSTIVLGYLSIELGFEELHFLIGYALVAPLVLRLYLFIFGNTYERLSAFAVIKDFTKYLKNKESYIGHNPLASLVMACMLMTISILFLSGLLLESFLEFQGLFVSLALEVSKETTAFIKNVHAYSFNLLLLFIALHLAGLGLSYKEDKTKHIQSIFTGRKNA